MANRPPELDDDDDFSEIYKEYTGPQVTKNEANVQDKAKAVKRSSPGSDEEDEPRDPNAVPTDFTSREAKVWEAKSKATERNWKKRKEEEMICKICGESGHFTQGCPSTLGANRKSQDLFQRVPARDKRVRTLFTEKVISNIEKDVGCKIKMDEKFLIVSGKDRLALAKGIDAVHKVINEEGGQKSSPSSHRSRSRSPGPSPLGSRSQRSEPQRSNSGTRNSPQFQPRYSRQEKSLEDRVREDLHKFSRGSPQAYGNNGPRGRSSYSRSPGHLQYKGNSNYSYDGPTDSVCSYRSDVERPGSDMRSGGRFENRSFPHSLEELELEFKKEAIDLTRIRDKEEDDENYKHRETLKEMREDYMRKVAVLRDRQAKEWEDFLRLDAQRRQQMAYHQQMTAGGFGGYENKGYSEYDGNPRFPGTSSPTESRSRYLNPMDNYPPRSHDNFGDLHHRRRDDFGRPYNRY